MVLVAVKHGLAPRVAGYDARAGRLPQTPGRCQVRPWCQHQLSHSLYIPIPMLVFGAQLADMRHRPAQQVLAREWYDYINLVGLSHRLCIEPV